MSRFGETCRCDRRSRAANFADPALELAMTPALAACDILGLEECYRGRRLERPAGRTGPLASDRLRLRTGPLRRQVPETPPPPLQPDSGTAVHDRAIHKRPAGRRRQAQSMAERDRRSPKSNKKRVETARIARYWIAINMFAASLETTSRRQQPRVSAPTEPERLPVTNVPTQPLPPLRSQRIEPIRLRFDYETAGIIVRKLKNRPQYIMHRTTRP